MNGVRLHVHMSTQATFGLIVSLSLALFLISGLFSVRLLHLWQLVRARSHVQKFLISLVNKKLNLLISMLTQS